MLMSRTAARSLCDEADRQVLAVGKASRTETGQTKERAFPFCANLGEPAQPSGIRVGILTGKALPGTSFKHACELGEAINAFIAVYNPTAKPL